MATTHTQITSIPDGVADLETAISDSFQELDDMFNGSASVDCSAGGNVVAAIAVTGRAFTLKLTGAPGAAFNLDIPASARFLHVVNNSGQDATVRPGGVGSGASVPAGTTRALYTDGTDIWQFALTVSITGAGLIKRTVFTADGTWTPDANAETALIRCIGGGGGGGGGTGPGTTNGHGLGGGGGGGATAEKFIDGATMGGISSETVTIGLGSAGVKDATAATGGTTSVGTLCIASGGPGGRGRTNGGLGEAFPTTSQTGTGDLIIRGGVGGHGAPSHYNTLSGGNGGCSSLGGGGLGGRSFNTNVAGENGQAPGAGGGGGAGYNATGALGGNGADGVVIIDEYA